MKPEWYWASVGPLHERSSSCLGDRDDGVNDGGMALLGGLHLELLDEGQHQRAGRFRPGRRQLLRLGRELGAERRLDRRGRVGVDELQRFLGVSAGQERQEAREAALDLRDSFRIEPADRFSDPLDCAVVEPEVAGDLGLGLVALQHQRRDGVFQALRQ